MRRVMMGCDGALREHLGTELREYTMPGGHLVLLCQLCFVYETTAYDRTRLDWHKAVVARPDWLKPSRQIEG